GFLGLGFLMQTLNRLTTALEASEFFAPSPGNVEPTASPPATPIERPGALERLHPPVERAKSVFRIWIIVFGLVGAQMSWVLRPFIGGGKEFAIFRPRGGNFFEAVWTQLMHLLGARGHW